MPSFCIYKKRGVYYEARSKGAKSAAAFVVADMAHNIANKTTETPSFSNG
jgi:hypothetical protein